jgi:hypothetical protein
MFQPMTWSGRPAMWLIGTAIFELVLAAVFAVIGFFNEVVRFGFYLTAAGLGGVAILLLLWGRRMRRGYQEAQRLKVQGIPGQARIVSMRQTGVYMNEQPQIELTLEVTTAMQGPYQVVVKEWVPLMLLGRLTNGLPLPVKVDPIRPDNLVIEWDSAMGSPMAGAPTGIGMGSGMSVPPQADTTQYAPQAREAEKARLLATGVPGNATVVSATATGQVDSEGRPVYDLVLTIEVPGQPPMQGPARTGIPADRVDQLEPGDTVPLKVDPANPTVMTVDWDSA